LRGKSIPLPQIDESGRKKGGYKKIIFFKINNTSKKGCGAIQYLCRQILKQ
jgi:hypothetical protein